MLLVSELLDKYFTHKRLRKSTETSYRVACNAFIRRFGDCMVEEIGIHSILQWRAEILDVSVKPVSWNTYVRHLKILYKFALNQGDIATLNNPFEGCKVRCTKKVDKTLSKSDIRKARGFLDMMETEEISWGQISSLHPAWFWRTVFETFLYTGMRANELICLRMEDIDLAEGMIRIVSRTSKNHEERKIPIHHKLFDYMKLLVLRAKKSNMRPDQQLFDVNKFSSKHHRDSMDMNQVSAFYKKLNKHARVRMSPHRFRHTVATELMREEDRNIHTVKDLLGHQNIATTMKYISVNHKQMRDLLNTIV